METYSRIGLLRSYGNLQSYWTNTKLWKPTVVLAYLSIIGQSTRVHSVTLLLVELKKWDLEVAIYPTSFECSFSSSPLVSSLFLHFLHSIWVYLYIFSTRFECIFTSSLLVSSVFFRWQVARGYWFKSTCVPPPGRYTSALGWAADRRGSYCVKRHSKRVEKVLNYTQNEWRRC
jgi:hypothetical protein